VSACCALQKCLSSLLFSFANHCSFNTGRAEMVAKVDKTISEKICVCACCEEKEAISLIAVGPPVELFIREC
jgi:hypothetical protein